MGILSRFPGAGGRVSALLGLTILLYSLSGCSHAGNREEVPAARYPGPEFRPIGTPVDRILSPGAVILTAVGDVMFGRRVEEARREPDAPDPFEAVKETLRYSDVTFCNLECVLGQESDFKKWKSYDKIRLGAPAGSVEHLVSAGFDVVSLGNNHVLDFGKEGLKSTVDILRRAGIGASGYWYGDANRPFLLSVKGVRMAFLSYSDVSPSYFKAGAKDPGTVPPLPEILERDIPRARKNADRVVVSVHWGEEYRRIPTAKQRRIARRMVDLGADVVLGHHPHVLQPFERYKKGFIAYSLGNFLFDLESPRSKESMVLRLVLEPGEPPRGEWAPVEIRDCFPVFLEGEEAETAVQCLPTSLPKLAPRAPAR